MKLKPKILLNSISSLVFILMIGSLFLVSINKSEEENEKNEVANRISKNIAELNIVTNDYIKDKKEKSKEQWSLKYENSYKNLDSNIFDEQDEIEIVKGIKEGHKEIGKLFLQISSKESNEELEKEISKQISKESLTISSESFKLSNLLREKAEKSQQKLILIFAIFVAILIGISILINLYLTNLILKPLSYIVQGTKEIERGNFRSRININTGDEIEELGKSFNETMKALEKLELKREELEHAKTEFLSVTSHELRSPMTPMKAQLQMLKEDYFGRLNSKQYNSIDIVLRNTERLDGIIMDLLEISRIEAARLKFNFIKVDLKKYLQKIIDEMSGFLIDKNIQLIPRFEKFPEFECDPDRIIQVLRNLLENSIKFSERNSRIMVNAKKAGDFIQFSVRDFGIGISEENQKKLFEPFFQGEKSIYRKYGGTGLGLSICKGIVKSQGGKIYVKSILGKGSEFIFTFPLKPVKEIKPIKLMFSSSIEEDLEVLEVLKEFLGPLAKREFATIKGPRDYKTIMKYIEDLKSKDILSQKQFLDIKKMMAEIYGRVETSEVTKLIGLTKKRKEKEKIIQEIVSLTYKLYGDVAIKKANSVEGLKVGKNGKILSLKADKEEILNSLGVIYTDLVGDLTRFLKRKEDLNNKQPLLNKKEENEFTKKDS